MKFYSGHKKLFLITGTLIFLVFLLGASNSAYAANVGDIVNFNVDKSFDTNSRTQISSTLVKIGSKLYFYIEKPWWDAQTPLKQAEILADLDSLSNEFDSNIYPTLSSLFGSEWNPGIDKDPRITVLFESMNVTEGGYFREADEYEKIQVPTSNEREMLYISVSNVTDLNVKVLLGHEFTHLITFNQKNKIFGVEEDTWLNEARADFSSTILGYDDNYQRSNLQQRVKDFIENPSDSITNWSGTKYDYASVSMFAHYLADHYGVSILSSSLKSKSIGIASINEVLLNKGAKEDFTKVFENWLITLIVNDCSDNSVYCYLNKNLVSLRVSPPLIFLPLTGNTSLSSADVTRSWAGNWQKIIGGSGNLKLDFSSLQGLNFKVPYIIYNKNGGYSVKVLELNSDQKGEINIQDFGTKYNSLVLTPFLPEKFSGLDGSDLIYPYNFTVSITGKDSASDEDVLIQKLLAEIDSLKKQIADLLARKQGVVNVQSPSCSQLSSDLYFGMENNNDVKCLQVFLKNQGADIYPEGLVTGNFASLTKAAVIRFQEKYASEILTPLGLSASTGYVGPSTRGKINQILSGV